MNFITILIQSGKALSTRKKQVLHDQFTVYDPQDTDDPFLHLEPAPPHPNTDKASSGLLCLPGVLPEVHMSSALREKLPFVKRGDTNRGFQNSHVFLVPHLVSLSTRSCQFRAPFS